MKLAALMLSLATSLSAANYYVSPNASGDGTINNPGSLLTAIAHTGWAASIVGGDTVYLRGGTYTNGTNIAFMQFSGSAGNLVTWKNYPLERAKWNFPLRFQTRDYHRFYGLEIYDSNVAMREDAIGHFDSTTGLNNEWINCIIHDLAGVWTGGSGGNLIRGCIIWYSGNTYRHHVVYPWCRAFEQNIVMWTSGDAYELGTDAGTVRSNIFLGTGLTTGTDQAATILFTAGAAGGAFVGYNVLYETSVSSRGIQIQLLSPFGPIAMTNNFIHSGDPIRLTGTYTSAVINSNTSYSSRPVTTYVLRRTDPSGSWTVNGQAYFSAHSSLNFEDGGVLKSFLTWTNDNVGYDTTSTALAATTPADRIYVFSVEDERPRANIAIVNYSGASTVAVSLTGVLQAGDRYHLYNAEDYDRGYVQSGIYNGTSITVPMTGLTVAPILYATNLIQPTTTAPTFGVFVVRKANNRADVASVTGEMTVEQR